MDMETFLLFLACLLFGSFNMYLNIKTKSVFLKSMTFTILIAVLAGTFYMLVLALTKAFLGW